ncbi:MFS transporter [Novosphingobium rosa]|uniref:MFS transporter n=1 Tax=Novosphingobium rosa TaxID=76978 RepID=UPI00082D5E44|nr:MFS transporter [Novosphingobium rosa]
MDPQATHTYRRVMARVVAPLAALIVLSSVDRVNISFAAMAMRHDIGLGQAAYGLGAGLFFVGYLLCQLPSMALLQRVGARRWIAFSVIGWGLTAGAMSLIQVPWQFFVLRVILGAFESGFAPGVVWYVSLWLPEAWRGRSIGLTLLAIPLSVILGGPLCGWLLKLEVAGLPGWRLMFAAEGLATVLAGLAAAAWFVDGPAQARWLSAESRWWIARALAAEDGPKAVAAPLDMPALWRCALLWLVLVTSANGLIFWLPSAIGGTGIRNPLAIGVLTALPWIAIALGMMLNARHSDRTGERYRHLGVAMLLGAVGLAVAGFVGGGAVALGALMLGGLGLGGAQSVFWTIPTARFAGARARAIALINLCGNVGSVVAPAAIGWIAQKSGALAMPVVALACWLALSVLLILPLEKSPIISSLRSRL